MTGLAAALGLWAALSVTSEAERPVKASGDLESLTLAQAVEGEWTVRERSLGALELGGRPGALLGRLILRGGSYEFRLVKDAPIGKDHRRYVPYLRQPRGKYEVTYGLAPATSVRQALERTPPGQLVLLATISFPKLETSTDSFSITYLPQEGRLIFMPAFHSIVRNDPCEVTREK